LPSAHLSAVTARLILSDPLLSISFGLEPKHCTVHAVSANHLNVESVSVRAKDDFVGCHAQ
jgi:hypothetical protein